MTRKYFAWKTKTLTQTTTTWKEGEKTKSRNALHQVKKKQRKSSKCPFPQSRTSSILRKTKEKQKLARELINIDFAKEEKQNLLFLLVLILTISIFATVFIFLVYIIPNSSSKLTLYCFSIFFVFFSVFIQVCF